MKTKILATMLFITMWGVESCTKDTSSGYNAQLPPETQVGANTFGVTIKGKVYVPRDPTGGNGVNPSSKGMIFWASPDSITWDELEVKDGASAVGFNIYLHIQNLKAIGVNTYALHQSNFHNQVDSTPFTHIYFKIWDSNISNYAYYGSIESLGEINITRYDLPNRIVSGNFKGKFVRYDNPNDFITITDGRFDLNWYTVQSTPFP
jgi:hypothetical protein